MPLDKTTVNAIRESTSYGPWLRANDYSIREMLMATIDRNWAGDSIEAEEGNEISNTLASLTEAEIIASPVGARADLDVLQAGGTGVDVRVMVDIGNHLLVNRHAGLYLFLNADIAADDPNPGAARMLHAVTSVLDAANRMLAGFFTDFQPRN